MPVPPDGGGPTHELSDAGRNIVALATSIAAFLGRTSRGPTNQPELVETFDDFERVFGALDLDYPLGYALRDFFVNGGGRAIVVRIPPSDGDGASGGRLGMEDYLGSEEDRTGIFALLNADLFNLLCIPADTWTGTTDPAVYRHAAAFCEEHRAMLIVDSPADWSSNDPATAVLSDPLKALAALGIQGTSARNAALYFPRLLAAEPSCPRGIGAFVPCGAIAGVIARTDAQAGVWKAPAGRSAEIAGVQGLEVNLDDEDTGRLNRLGINCLRSFPGIGPAVWGARTLSGADNLGDEYRYVSVRRLALFIEESLYRGTQWTVFEPNDESLRAQIRTAAGAFLHDLSSGAPFRAPPRETRIS